jgi:hypothetical protein
MVNGEAELTGFTFEVDGHPEAVERLHAALIKEMQALWREAEKRAADDTLALGLVAPYLRPVYPVTGMIQLRTRFGS